MVKLAVHGGEPVRIKPFPVYNTLGKEEREAVIDVLDSGVLSGYLGRFGPGFYGGPRVQKLEREMANYFGVKNAVCMNSATSCLYSAVGALGIKPGDEVIVSPYTMVASVTAAAVYGATPVFADVDPDTFCLTPESVCNCVTPKTKAVIVVDLFGYPVDIPTIRDAAGVPVIEDAAQAPGAARDLNYCGTQADIGVLSLNYHKTIHCGEGGVAMTNNDELAERLQLIRNHGEAVVAELGYHHDIIGYNYRLNEIEAAIAYEQLKKLDRLVAQRSIRTNYLYRGLSDIDILGLTNTPVNSIHGYYVFPIKALPPVERNWFVEAIQCEGIPLKAGYTKPIYLEPLYSKYKAWCPVVENIEFTKLMTTTVHYSGERKDIDDVIEAFQKVSGFVKRCSSP